MIRIKVMKLSGLIYPVIIGFLVLAILFLAIRLINNDPVSMNALLRLNSQSQAADEGHVSDMYKIILASGIPGVATDQSSDGQGVFSSLWGLLSKKDIRDPRTIMVYQMPYLNGLESLMPENAIEVAGTFEIPDRSTAVRPSLDPIEIIHESQSEHTENFLSDDIKILIDQIEDNLDIIELSGHGPQVMIYHSHSREAYRQNPTDPYKVAEAFRSNDLNHTVIKVGEVLSNHLKAKGIPVLHDETEHEQGDFNSSYIKSLDTLEKRMAEYDSLQIFLDIHRNAYDPKSSKHPDDEVVIINGERVAKVFVVIGTGQGVMGGFRDKPQWEENAKFALKLTNKINELYPGLAKDIYYNTGRYNQHVSTKAILVEVGSTLTTLEEAKRATAYLAEALSQIVE